MSKNYGALSASLVLSVFSLAVACSGSSDSPAAANSGEAGDDAGGAATNSSAGAADVAGAAGAAGTGNVSAEGGAAGEPAVINGGTSGVAGGAGAMVTPNNSPCSYAVTGGKAFPDAGAKFLCTASSRVYQQNGTGSFNALIGAGSYMDASGSDSSTVACSIDSATAPKAGDTWTMNTTDHAGNCDLSLTHMNAATIWANSSNSAPSGTASITFVSATLKHGMYKPEDVYYLYEVNVSITFAHQQGGAPDVTFTGHFTQNSLPLGG
jgi:hypothetical protein